ncbi:MAG: Re/Si-specific NAD(P)(+) transhydrogenase subunit alpha [Propionibacteriaceae bacterium]|jgi:NAD(P) transhydrogenase subunit alpha|nr:Re/Si-specific NAD(P)(+) transhydrogenase subunit alpha [Propionibacteriaceae bacterium]
MQIGIPLESRPDETRVSATPKTVTQLVGLGYEVVVERGAGSKASYPDADYEAAGATLVGRGDAWASDIVCKINPPIDAEIQAMSEGATFIGLINAARSPELLEKLAERKLTVLAMDSVPRISRAQSLDVLSSMANIAGYRAVIEAANAFGSFFTGQVTAAGKVPPAKVFVSGAGVAGLAAIGTARSLGAIVRATDIRPEVAEQVESMGADFINVDVGEQQESSDGYAKEASSDYAEAAAAMYAEQSKDVDIIVTTALIPGKPAPRLITEEMVRQMKPGSVVVDMAAANGGNVAGSVPDDVVVTPNGVKIIGYTDLAGRLPTQASQLYGTNVVNLMKLITPEKDGVLVLDMNDVVQRGITVVSAGEVTWPPPPIAVSAAPAVPATAAPPAVVEPAPPKKRSPYAGPIVMAVCALALLALFWVSPENLLGHFMVFMLSVVIGFYVIGNVNHALHTPLMSVTNAISGIIIVGSLVGLHSASTSAAVAVLSITGILLASINIFGGFTVTQRMLTMFRKA